MGPWPMDGIVWLLTAFATLGTAIFGLLAQCILVAALRPRRPGEGLLARLSRASAGPLGAGAVAVMALLIDAGVHSPDGERALDRLALVVPAAAILLWVVLDLALLRRPRLPYELPD